MKQTPMYHIDIGVPIQDNGGWSLGIRLWPSWRNAVAKSIITQEGVNNVIDNMGRAWLDACGYDRIFDPDNCGFDADPKRPPGPSARHMYRPNIDLRVTWGEWGPEHITVPGDACGLDITTGLDTPEGGRSLMPHNLDTMRQLVLLLLVFTWFAGSLTMQRGSSGS